MKAGLPEPGSDLLAHIANDILRHGTPSPVTLKKREMFSHEEILRSVGIFREAMADLTPMP